MRERSHYRRKPPQLIQITSLLDIMTILLFFLLKHYSATESFPISENLQLPKSVSTRPTTPALNIAISTNEIAVDGVHVVALSDSPIPGEKEIPLTVLGEDPDVIVPLLAELAKKRANVQALEAQNPKYAFSGYCTVQADQTLPFHLIRKILYTAGQAGYVMLNLAVSPTSETF